MGSDGTLGVQAIKEHRGIALVQEPRTAQYDSMPVSAIGTGLVDHVLPVKDMPAKLAHLMQGHPAAPRGEDIHLHYKETSDIQKLLLLVRDQTGHDLSLYKKNTIYRRIMRRLELHEIKSIADYVTFLHTNRHEVDILFKELLIGVTKFFRDSEGFAALQDVLVPLLKSKGLENPVRIWVPACSTGEEAYSIAIIAREYFDKIRVAGKVQIYASDINPASINTARAGCYPASIAADVSKERLGRFFTIKDNKYCVRKEIREMIVFGNMMSPGTLLLCGLTLFPAEIFLFT